MVVRFFRTTSQNSSNHEISELKKSSVILGTFFCPLYLI
nr:MAG TPA: hypothetical protein [Caudoviricetes sp.]